MVETPEPGRRQVREPPFCGTVRDNVPAEIVLGLVRAFHDGRLPPGAEQLSDHAGKYEAYFVPLPQPAGEVLFKHFSHRKLSKIVWPFLGISTATHSWRIAERLRTGRPLCSPPLAAIERRWGPIVLDSYFVGEWIQPGASYVEAAVESLVGGTRTKDRILQDLAEFMAELHARHVVHAGLHAGNILEESGDPPRLLAIDLDAAAIRPSVSNHDRMRMLFDAFEYFVSVCDPMDFGTLVGHYARAAHIPAGALEAHMPPLAARLEQRRRDQEDVLALYREERVISLLTHPRRRPWQGRIRSDYAESWESILAKLKERGLACAARHHADRIRDAAPEDWLQRLEQEAKHEEAEAEEAIAALHHYVAALLDAGIRLVLLGSLPLLQYYGHPLGAALLTPFEIAVRPDDAEKASELAGQQPTLHVKVEHKVELATEGRRAVLTVEQMMGSVEPFDLCGLDILALAPEMALLYYAARLGAAATGRRSAALLDLTVFLTHRTAEIDAGKAAGLARELSAEGPLWHAVRMAKPLNMEQYPAVDAVLHRLVARE